MKRINTKSYDGPWRASDDWSGAEGGGCVRTQAPGTRAKHGPMTPGCAHIMIILIFLALPLFGESELPLLNKVLVNVSVADRLALIEDGEIIRFQHGGFTANLIPSNELGRLVADSLQSGTLTLGLEGLFLMPLSGLPQPWFSLSENKRNLILFNILRSVSTLTGLEYYSASRKRMRLLFEESWVIPNPDSPEIALPDPLLDSLPENPVVIEDSMFIHQKDKSFASNRSRLITRARDNAFSSTIINLTPLRYWGIIRVVQPEAMQTHLVVVPVKEGLLVYGVIAAETLDSRMFMDKAQASFTNRIKALSGWYMDRLVKSF